MSDPSDKPTENVEHNQKAEDQQRRTGRPPAFSEEKRRIILAMLKNGSSRPRRRQVRRLHPPTTIYRTLKRDPAFAEAVAMAEHHVEIEALRRARRPPERTATRAAAWLLERRNPTDFAARDPTALTPEQVALMFCKAVHSLLQGMSDEDYDAAFARFDALVEQANKAPAGRR